MGKRSKRPPRRKYESHRQASICHWTARLSFRTKAQAEGFINSYMEWSEIPLAFSYKCVSGDSFNPDEHIIEIDGAWAKNLRFVAKLAHWWDYSDRDDAVGWVMGRDD